MAASLQTAVQMNFFEWKSLIFLFKKSLKSVPMCPINSKPLLVQMIARCQTGSKALPKPMVAYVNNSGNEILKLCYI